MILLDLFSGTGGFAKGFHDAGYVFEKHYFSEIDKHAIANYQYNFKDSIHVGSITTLSGNEIERPNLITFGFPCQDLSVAGNGKGFDGTRSVLFYEAVRLIQYFKPEVFIFENVKGLLSNQNGKTFEAVLRTIADLGLYDCEWQLLNTLWLLPQNRERIFFVGYLRGKCKPGIFPLRKFHKLFTQEAEPNQGQPQAKYYSSALRIKNMKADDTYINAPKFSWALCGGGNSGGLHSDMTTIQIGTFRTHNEDKGFRESKSGVCPTLPARARNDASGSPVIVAQRGRNGIQEFEESKIDATNTLTSVHKDNYVKVFSTMGRSGDPKKGGTGILSKENESFCLDTANSMAIEQTNALRRLTEIECERLQGFPDNWTKYGLFNDKVKEISKTQRYKMLGNAVTVSIVKEIAQELKPKIYDIHI